MKVALLLYGLPRFIDDEQPIQFYRNSIMSKYTTDVYAHCWFQPDHLEKKSPWTGKSHYLETTSVQPDSHPIPTNAIELIKTQYNPIKLKYEFPQEFQFQKEVKSILDSKFTNKHSNYTERGYSNILSQYKSIEEVTNLVLTSKKKYDIFVMGRYDITTSNFPSNLETLDTEKIHTQDCNEFPDGIHIYGNRFLKWFNELFEDARSNIDLCKLIQRPSSEMIKKAYLQYKYDMSFHKKHPMRINILRK